MHFSKKVLIKASGKNPVLFPGKKLLTKLILSNR